MLRLTTAFSVCLLTSLAGCTREGPAYAPKPADVAAVVEMTNAFFSPEAVRIPVGGTVEWRNTSITTHTGRWKSRRMGVVLAPLPGQGRSVRQDFHRPVSHRHRRPLQDP